MANDTCPHCGAEPYAEKVGDLVRFDCGTVFDTDEWVTFERSDDCYERQLAQKDAEIEMLRTANETMAGLVLLGGAVLRVQTLKRTAG